MKNICAEQSKPANDFITMESHVRHCVSYYEPIGQRTVYSTACSGLQMKHDSSALLVLLRGIQCKKGPVNGKALQLRTSLRVGEPKRRLQEVWALS